MSKLNLNGLGAGLLSDKSKDVATNEFKVTYIPLENIVPNEKNEGFSMDGIEDLKTSIKDVGLQQNLVVRKKDDDTYMLLTGHRRLQALKELFAEGNTKFIQAPCVVINLDGIDLPLNDTLKEQYALATTNAEARVNTPADVFKLTQMLTEVYDELAKNGRMGIKKREFIAEKLNVSPRTVQKALSVDAKLNKDFRTEIEEGNMPLDTAVEVAKLPVEKQDELYEKSKAENIPVSVEVVKDFNETGKVKKEPAPKTKTVDTLTKNSYKVTKKELTEATSLFDELVDEMGVGVNVSKGDYAKIVDATEVINKQIAKIIKIIQQN